MRAATGTREPDPTLVRRLAIEGAEASLRTASGRREAAARLLAAMDAGEFSCDLDAIERLNDPGR